MKFQDEDEDLIPEYHSCKILGSEILKMGNNSKNFICIFFNFSSNILFIIPYQLTQVLSF